MTPPTASIATRRRSSARAAARRGPRARRGMLVAAIVIVVAVAIPLALPLFEKALNEFNLPLTNADVIREQAAEKRLDPALIAAVIYAETKFNPRPSSAGAQGLMQIEPGTAEFLARRSGATTFALSDLSAPQVNIAYGAYYLRYLLDRYGGSTTLALAAYNGGEANVDRWLAKERARGRQFTIDDIPFPETRAYVLRVRQAQGDYRRTYASELGYQ